MTKSDVLGHILPRLKFQWAHDNIAEFFERIVEHGYVLVFLTARPVTSKDSTVSYLGSVEQNGFKLPVCPVFTSCKSLYESLNGELLKKSHW